MTRRSAHFSPLVRLLIAACLLILCTLAHAQATSPTQPATAPQSLLGQYQQETITSAITGSWIGDIGGTSIRLSLKSDRTFTLDALKGTWELSAGQITLHSAGKTTTYNYDLTKDSLTLKGGDLRSDLQFHHMTDILGTVGEWFHITPADLKQRLVRILTVLGIMIAARLLIYALQGISTFFVHSRFSPIGFIWRGQKRRVRTLHFLILNIAKYMIYLAAIGFILSELGINYTTYIASLSVIGLAIGFGSQGLVQDMVTGFFVIFEAQFDVGDMVDISGVTGLVMELGLRTTKLRNYTGQTIIVPNRNISVVGNYLMGSQTATIDVDLAKPADGDHACKVLEALAEEVYKEFGGTITRTPVADGPLKREDGSVYARLHITIWPTQNWVVDQQLVPRIRDAFKQATIDIAGDRVAAFYYAREQVKQVSFRDRIKEQLQWAKPNSQDEPYADDGDI